jgi:predicted DNA-binding ribbon-helix-helix protein
MPSPTELQKHSVTIAGHRTSVTLEAIFWETLRAIAKRRKTTIAQLVVEIDRRRGDEKTAPNLSSAIRVFVLQAANRNGDAE